jgi:hypothetical protein
MYSIIDVIIDIIQVNGFKNVIIDNLRYINVGNVSKLYLHPYSNKNCI